MIILNEETARKVIAKMDTKVDVSYVLHSTTMILAIYDTDDTEPGNDTLTTMVTHFEVGGCEYAKVEWVNMGVTEAGSADVSTGTMVVDLDDVWTLMAEDMRNCYRAWHNLVVGAGLHGHLNYASIQLLFHH